MTQGSIFGPLLFHIFFVHIFFITDDMDIENIKVLYISEKSNIFAADNIDGVTTILGILQTLL